MFGLLILGALILYIVFAIWIVKRQKTKRAKWIAIAILVLIPTWDQLIGRVYFYTLCTTQGGVKVYSTVELPSEFFDEGGVAKFKPSKEKGVLSELMGKYTVTLEGDTISKLLRMEKDTFVVKDSTRNQILGSDTSFLYFGGWVSFAAHRTADRCPTRDQEGNRALYRAVFYKVPETK